MFLDDDNIKDTTTTRIGLTTISIKLGKNITNAYLTTIYQELYKLSVTPHQPKVFFREFKQEYLNTSQQSVTATDEFYVRLAGKLIEIMTSSGVIDLKVQKVKDKSLTILILSEEVEKLIVKPHSLAVLPMNLPMIVQPKNFSKNELGGYLVNDIEYADPLISAKIGYKNPSIIEDDNIIYNTVNNMMQTPFKINNDLLNYLLKYNHIHNLLLNSDYEHEYANIKKNCKTRKRI